MVALHVALIGDSNDGKGLPRAYLHHLLVVEQLAATASIACKGMLSDYVANGQELAHAVLTNWLKYKPIARHQVERIIP